MIVKMEELTVETCFYAIVPTCYIDISAIRISMRSIYLL